MPDAVVGIVEDIIAPSAQPESAGIEPDRRLRVRFEDGDVGYVDPDDRLHIYALRTLRRLSHPAYAEREPLTRTIRLVRVPHVARVLAIEDDLPSGDFHVHLDTSNVRYVVRRSALDESRYEQVRQLLRESIGESDVNKKPVLFVTNRDDQSIIHCRRAPDEIAAAQPPLGPEDPDAAAFAAIDTVTLDEANRMFAEMDARSCNLDAPSPGCIPFLYIEEGCHARAHRMCQLMERGGVRAGKIWIYGRLEVRTHNHPDCAYGWFWHVAPVVRMTEAPDDVYVIDPSVCSSAVGRVEWQHALGAQALPVVFTDTSIYVRHSADHVVHEPPRNTDGSDDTTERFLRIYAVALRYRVDECGRPPYECQPAQTGTVG